MFPIFDDRLNVLCVKLEIVGNKEQSKAMVQKRDQLRKPLVQQVIAVDFVQSVVRAYSLEKIFAQNLYFDVVAPDDSGDPLVRFDDSVFILD